MDRGDEHPLLTSDSDLRSYFHTSLQAALSNQHLRTDDTTASYLVNLLCYFSRTETLFEPTREGTTSPILANLYADAIAAESRLQRQQLLKRLGDVALFIAGIFSDSLNRKIVDIDYYIAMGGKAYAFLSSTFQNTQPDSTNCAVFADLSQRFSLFVDVLNEVSEQAHMTNAEDVLRLYEIWLRTGSPRAACRLRRLGITPAAGAVSRTHH